MLVLKKFISSIGKNFCTQKENFSTVSAVAVRTYPKKFKLAVCQNEVSREPHQTLDFIKKIIEKSAENGA